MAATAHLVLAVQVVLVLSNLNPLLPTDGYHAFEAGVGSLNFRRRAFALHRAPPVSPASAGGADVGPPVPPGRLLRLLGRGCPVRVVHRGRRRHRPADPSHGRRTVGDDRIFFPA